MGEYVWTVINVGGSIRRKDVAKLTAFIERFAGEQNDGIDDSSNPLPGEVIRLQGPVNFGNIGDAAEAGLNRMGLSWRVHFDACSGCWAGGIRQWLAGQPGAEECSADENGPVICLTDLVEAQAKGAALADVIAELNRFTVEIPPLRIIEDHDHPDTFAESANGVSGALTL